MRAELPSKSPTVGLNWARAIFIRSYRIRFGRGQFNSGQPKRVAVAVEFVIAGAGLGVKPRPFFGPGFGGTTRSENMCFFAIRRGAVFCFVGVMAFLIILVCD